MCWMGHWKSQIRLLDKYLRIFYPLLASNAVTSFTRVSCSIYQDYQLPKQNPGMSKC